MGVNNYKIIQENGRKITLMFVLDNKEYRYICDEYEHQSDNFRAAQLALKYLWQIYEDYCVKCEGGEASLSTLLKGFRVLKSEQKLLALEAPKTKPWDILCIERDSTIDEVNKAYHDLSRSAHPDQGGSNKEFIRVKKARDEMLEMLN